MSGRREWFERRLLLFARLGMVLGSLFPSKFSLSSFVFGSLIMMNRLGIEGLVMFKRDTEFDAENYTLTIPGDNPVTISVFDKVLVSIEVQKDRNTQRGKVSMTLVEPVDSRNL